MPQREDLAQRLARMLQRDARVQAVFLGGSLAAGTADSYSDLDLFAVTEHRESVAALCRGYLQQCAELVYWSRLPDPSFLCNGITADGTRCDFFILTPAEIRTRARDSLRVLWDRARIAETLCPPGAPADRGADLLALANEFVRVLGLLPVVTGREEHHLGTSGAAVLRNHLMTLLLEIDAAPGRGAALRLNPFLSEESRRVLEEIPSPESSRESVIAAYAACARAFLPRAKALADELGTGWPERFVAVTLQRLQSDLGIDIDAS